jgi:hypothetical protein
MEWLKQVSRENINIDGAPTVSDEERRAASNFIIKSNPKRTNHY